MSPAKMDTDNYYLYKLTATPVLPVYGQTLNGRNGWTRYEAGDEIEIPQAILVAEYSPIHRCVGAGVYS